ncbi:hypothetical protein V8G54_004804 [Vigna mungo]|uniref:Uncharacterized protein n=1 Tax=Vigna mungo TaxID=3915 RepID=A0AAQ3PF27_VIGMU
MLSKLSGPGAPKGGLGATERGLGAPEGRWAPLGCCFMQIWRPGAPGGRWAPFDSLFCVFMAPGRPRRGRWARLALICRKWRDWERPLEAIWGCWEALPLLLGSSSFINGRRWVMNWRWNCEGEAHMEHGAPAKDLGKGFASSLCPLGKNDIYHLLRRDRCTCRWAQTKNPKAPLRHPFLITHLCALVGVDTSEAPFERPRATINRSYYIQYCLLDEEGIPIPPPQPPRRHRRRDHAPPQQPLGPDQQASPDYPASHDSFMMAEMRDMMQRMEERMDTLHQMGRPQEARMEAINRIGRAQAEMMRQDFGASHPDFMTPAEYDAFAPTAGGAMEEDDTEVEDDEDGTEVDDVEDDYEEDDSDVGTEILELDEDEEDD